MTKIRAITDQFHILVYNTHWQLLHTIESLGMKPAYALSEMQKVTKRIETTTE